MTTIGRHVRFIHGRCNVVRDVRFCIEKLILVKMSLYSLSSHVTAGRLGRQRAHLTKVQRTLGRCAKVRSVCVCVCVRVRVRGAWCVVRGAWCVVRGAWCVVRGAWCVVRGAWCVVRGAYVCKVCVVCVHVCVRGDAYTVSVCACVCGCVRACVRACVRVWVRAYVTACHRVSFNKFQTNPCIQNMLLQ